MATIGPASSAEPVLARLIEAGMDGARLNFSHGTHDEHGASAQRIRDAQSAAGRPLAVIADLLHDRFEIEHSTIQIETPDFDEPGGVCFT